MMTRKRRNKILKLAKGYWGAKSKHFKMANEQVMKSLTYAYTGRRLKKRDFRSLWITRISAACKLNGMNYSTFMNGLKKSGVEINRKMLAELAVNDKAAFTALTDMAKAKLAGAFPYRPLPGPLSSGERTRFRLLVFFSCRGDRLSFFSAGCPSSLAVFSRSDYNENRYNFPSRRVLPAEAGRLERPLTLFLHRSRQKRVEI